MSEFELSEFELSEFELSEFKLSEFELSEICCLDKKNIIPAKALNASKRSFIAQHLINNPTCANNYNMNRFEIIKNCKNFFDSIKLEVFS